MMLPFLPSSVSDSLHAKRQQARADGLKAMFPDAYGDPASAQVEALNAALEQEDSLVQQSFNQAGRADMAAGNAATRRDSIQQRGVPQLDPTRSMLLGMGGVTADILNPGGGGSQQLAQAGQQAYSRNAAAYEDRLGGANTDLAYRRSLAANSEEQARAMLAASFGRDTQLAQGGLQAVQGRADQARTRQFKLADDATQRTHEVRLKNIEASWHREQPGGAKSMKDAALGIVGMMQDPRAKLHLMRFFDNAEVHRKRAGEAKDGKKAQEALDAASDIDDTVIQYIEAAAEADGKGGLVFKPQDYSQLQLMGEAIALRGDGEKPEGARKKLLRSKALEGLPHAEADARVTKALGSLWSRAPQTDAQSQGGFKMPSAADILTGVARQTAKNFNFLSDF